MLLLHFSCQTGSFPSCPLDYIQSLCVCFAHVGDRGECECTSLLSPIGQPGPAGDRGDAGMAGEFGKVGDVGDPGPQGEDGVPVRMIKSNASSSFCSFNVAFILSPLLCVQTISAPLSCRDRKGSQVGPVQRVKKGPILWSRRKVQYICL